MSFKEKTREIKKEEQACAQCPESLQEKSELEDMKKELEKTKELLLRTAAEYDNFRKRSEREKEAIYSDASACAVLSILPLADSLDAAEKSSEIGSEEYKKGIELLKNQLESALKSLKVESFGEPGEDFDPNLHNAILHKEDENENQSFISNIFQKGYKIGDKVIRHAMVEVTN